jgi:four helix bundle protein
MKKVKSFENLIVWQKSHLLTLDIYDLSKNFPEEEKFGITTQIRRAAYSISSNIVEGHSRKSKKEFLQFLYIAKGSLEEVKYFLRLSYDLHYITEKNYKEIKEKADEVSKLLHKFTKSLLNAER